MFTSQSGNSNPKLKTYFGRNEMQIFYTWSACWNHTRWCRCRERGNKGSPALKGRDPILPFGGFPINYFLSFLSLSFSLGHLGVAKFRKLIGAENMLHWSMDRAIHVLKMGYRTPSSIAWVQHTHTMIRTAHIFFWDAPWQCHARPRTHTCRKDLEVPATVSSPILFTLRLMGPFICREG